MPGDFDDLLDQQIAKNKKGAKPTKESPVVGDFDYMLDAQAKEAPLPEATGPDTVQGGIVFMHPVTKEKAEQYANDEVPWYRKADFGLSDGKKFDTISQEEADKRDANTGNAYTLARDILSVPVGAAMAAGEYAKDRLFDEGGWAAGQKPLKEYYREALELGNQGEGATGLLGDPSNLLGGVAKPLAGIPYVGSAPVRGALEGGAMSLAEQANTGDKNINLYALGAGSALGGLLDGVGGALGKRAGEVERSMAEKKLAKEDPISFIWDNPELQQAQKVSAEARNQIDPNGLYTRYNKSFRFNPKTRQMEMHPSDYKELLADIKSSIADNAILPRKKSTITNREAREHLENIIKQVETVPEKMVNLAPYEPSKNMFKGLLENTVPTGIGGYMGHQVMGIPGMIVGGVIANPTAREKLGQVLTKGVDLGARASITPLGKAAKLVPYTPLGVQGIDYGAEKIDRTKKK